MNRQSDRRRRFFANNLHRELFVLVSLAAIVPMVITAAALFYLIFYITAQEIGIPEAIVYTLLPAARRVMFILLVLTPICVGVILAFAHRITHRIVGPFGRIVRELGERIEGTRQGPIILRKDSKFQPLVDKINLLLEKLKES